MGDTQWRELDGEAEVVRAKGQEYQRIAAAIQRSTRSLRAIVDDTRTTAQSMTATRKLAGDVLEDIGKAFDRYDHTGDALVAYAGELESAVSRSRTAQHRLDELRGELFLAESRQRRAEREVEFLAADASPADTAQARADQRAANREVTDLSGQVAHWEREWQDAKNTKDRAARTARGAIDEVVTGDKVHGLEDSGWDRFSHVLGSVYKVFKIVCDVAGVLAIFLSWVPFLGPLLLGLAAIGSILTIVESAIKFAKHEIGFGGMLLGVGLGIVGLFGGRLAANLGKVAKASAITRAAATTNSATRLATRLAGNVDDGARMISAAADTMAHADELLSMKAILASPFQLSDEAAEISSLFASGQINFGQAFARNLENVFVFPLKNPFGGSAELLRNPVYFHNADGTLLHGAVTMNLVNLGADLTGSLKDLAENRDGDDVGNAVNAVIGLPNAIVDGPYVKLAQLPANVLAWADDIDEVF